MPFRQRFPDYPGHGTWGPEIMHLVVMLVFLAAAVALVVWIVRSARAHDLAHRAMPSSPASPATSAGNRALEEARLRYARGEIGRDEFAQLSVDLGGPPVTP